LEVHAGTATVFVDERDTGPFEEQQVGFVLPTYNL
jgi:hypothetical protein